MVGSGSTIGFRQGMPVVVAPWVYAGTRGSELSTYPLPAGMAIAPGAQIDRIGAGSLGRQAMDEDVFNMSVRKFLKIVGVTSQREIEKAVRQAIAEGRLTGTETLAVSARLRIDDIDLETEIGGQIVLQ